VPHTDFGPFPTWFGVGGSPESVVRAARYGFSLMLAIIGGPPARFASFSRLFREAFSSSDSPRDSGGARARSRRRDGRAGDRAVRDALDRGHSEGQ
jgi:alkanesulfonate monooxygenase SsuD/methylene tetrahydromethanopterin reductase-like flavin-dependent oxidoreductase (luciferase family)